MSEDIVRTTGRPMTARLQRWLDSVDNREETIRTFETMKDETAKTWLTGLYEALALELRLVDLREQDLMQRLAQERSDELSEIDARHPYPPRTGKTAWYDPTTKTFHDTPPDTAA